MSSAIKKYCKLVDLLWDRTQKDSVPWEFENTRNMVKVWGGDNLVELAVSADDNFDSVYTLTMYNRSGQVMESFSDTFLNEVDAGEEFKNYFNKMESLFDLARRRATGADKALDDFIARLEEDNLDVPF